MIKLRIFSLIILIAIVSLGALFIDRDNILFWPLVILDILLFIMQAISVYDNFSDKKIRRIEFDTIAGMLRNPNPTKNAYLKQAYELLRRGCNKAGKEYLKKAIDFDPNDPEPLMLYGTLLMWDATWPYDLREKYTDDKLYRRLDEIAYYLKRALQIDPEHFMANVNYGVLLSERGKFSSAYKHFDKALKKHPKLPIARQQFGIAKARNGKIREAIRLFNEEKDLFGLTAHIAYCFGQVYESTGKLLLVQIYYEYAIRKYAGNFYLAHQRYIRVVSLRGEFQKAFKSHMLLLIMFLKVRYLKNIIRILFVYGPFNIVYFLFIYGLKLLNRMKIIPHSTRRLPKWVSKIYSAPYKTTSVTMIEAKFYREALGACRKGLLFRPYDMGLLSRISILYSWLDDYASAYYWARRLSNFYPEEYSVWHSLMGFSFALGKREEAVIYAKRALELMPDLHSDIVERTINYSKGDFSSMKFPLTFTQYDVRKKSYWVFEKGKDPRYFDPPMDKKL